MSKTGKLKRAALVWISGTFGVGVSLCASQAHASGFAAARFGGEHGHPTTDNATAIYYNPAGIALSKGTHIFIDGTMVLRWASYTRPGRGVVSSEETLDLAPGANDGKATLFNAIFSPFAGVTSDFGTDWIYGGAGLYFPFGGSAVWDKNPQYVGNEEFPGAQDGVQRWYSIDGTIRSMYITGALAFNIRKIGLSIGISGNAIRSEINTIRARNPDGSDDLVDVTPTGELRLKEGRSAIDAKGWQGSFGVGVVYDVLSLGKYFLGISYQSQPNVAGGMELNGTLDNVFTLQEPTSTSVVVTQTLPDILRFGVRVRPSPKWELRVFGDYQRWSVFDKQCVMEKAVSDRSCDFRGAGDALDDPESFGADDPDDPEDVVGVIQHLPRMWKDGGGVRVGASYWFIPELEGYLGTGYDSNAVPDETIDPALMDAHKMTFSAGVRWQIIKHLALAFTSTQVVFFRNSTEGKSALNRFQSPTKQPSGDGVYRQFFQLFNLYADISF